MNYNTIIIRTVVYKAFLAPNDKRSINIRIYNFEYCKTSLAIKYSELINIMSPYGFTKDVIHFNGMLEDALVYITIDGVGSKRYLNFLTKRYPEVANQKHYVTVAYGIYMMISPYMGMDDFCQRQHNNRIFKHNIYGYCYFKYIQDDGKNHDEYKQLFNKNYFIKSKHEAILYSGVKDIVTLLYTEWTDGSINFKYKQDNVKYKKMMRDIKLKTIFV